MSAAIERALAGLMALKQRWVLEGGPNALAEELDRRAGELGVTSPDTVRAFADGLRSAVRRPAPVLAPGGVPAPPPDPPEVTAAGGVEAAVSVAAQPALPHLAQLAKLYQAEVDLFKKKYPRLPVRNSGADRPGHVRVFTEHGGLVHGGEVRAANFRLVCKAYRFFEHSTTRQGVRHTEVVAGVCEQFAPDGRLLATWSTAERLQPRFASTTVALPATASVSTGTGFGYAHSGFYMSARRALDSMAPNPSVPGTDDGVPDPFLYTGRTIAYGKKNRLRYGLRSGFAIPPAPEVSVENPLFLGAAGEASPGFVFNTPYLSVCSLGPDTQDVVVAVLSAYRTAAFGPDPRVTRPAEFARNPGEWHIRLFRG